MKIKQLITKKFVLVVSMLAVMLSLAGCDDKVEKPFEYNEQDMVTNAMSLFEQYAAVDDDYVDYYMKSDDELAKSAIKGIKQAVNNDKVGTLESYNSYISAVNAYGSMMPGNVIPQEVFKVTEAADYVTVTLYNKASERDVEITVKYVENPDYYIEYDKAYTTEISNEYYQPDVFREYILSQGATEEDFLADYNSYTGTNVTTIEEFLANEKLAVADMIKSDLASNGIYPFKAEEMVVNAVYSKGELMAAAGKNTLIGMGTVFVVLLFISFIISLFKFLPALFAKKPKLEPEKKAEPDKVAATAPSAPVVDKASDDLMDDAELVAVITAAVYAAAGANTATSKDRLVVRSIKRARR